MSPEKSAQELPLVSVICRSMGRPELSHALQSISAQNYPNLEIVLVDASGKDLGDVSAFCAAVKLVLVADGKPRRRAAAANAGLDAASGEFLLLLDDDDWIAPAHISNLVRCLQSQSTIRAAYSNTQKTDAAGTPVDYVFGMAYDPVLLRRDNYIPIHAMLFHRSLLQAQCRFDTAFDIYEDWDFWLQLNQHTEFAHVDAITAFYREGGESGTAAHDPLSRYNNDSLLGRGRSAIFAKWLPRWSGAQLNQLIGSLDQSQTLEQLAAQLHEVHVNLDMANSAQQVLAAANAQLQGELDRANWHLKEKDQHIENLQMHVANQSRHNLELTDALQDIHASFSWKIMGPWRRIYRLLRSLFGKGSDLAP